MKSALITGKHLAFVLYVCILCSMAYTFASDKLRLSWTRTLSCLAFLSCVAFHGYVKKNLNFSGAVSSLIIGLIISLANLSFMSCLLTFYLTCSIATRFRKNLKKQIDGQANYLKNAQRNWIQVISNGGIPAMISVLYMHFQVPGSQSWVQLGSNTLPLYCVISLLACVSAANGDTWSSEIGRAILISEPKLVVAPWRKVPAGTNGGVTFIGFVVSLFGGWLIGVAFFFSEFILNGNSGGFLRISKITAFSGFVGSLIDSILGATMQYSGQCIKNLNGPGTNMPCYQNHTHKEIHISGCNILDNSSVNIISLAVITALATFLFV